jgi:hypothetical protein
MSERKSLGHHDTQHNDTQHNNKNAIPSTVTFSIIITSVMLSIVNADMENVQQDIAPIVAKRISENIVNLYVSFYPTSPLKKFLRKR